jgi:hypothetical protein
VEQNSELNLFLVLDLDPTKPWNQAEYEQRLQEKRREWSGIVNAGTPKAREADRNLKSMSNLKKIAADPAQRDAHAKKAQELKSSGRVAQEQELAEKLKLLQAKGHLLEEEVQNLIRKYAGTFSEKEIRGRIGVPIEKYSEPPRPVQEPLAPTSMRNIQQSLDHLKKNDLYDFLGGNRKTDTTALLSRTTEIDRPIHEKAGKTFEDDQTLILIGYCKDIFSSSEKTARYNESLRRKKYDKLKQSAKEIGAVTREISPAQISALLHDASEENLDIDETLAVLKEYTHELGYHLILAADTVATVARLQQCGYCFTLNPADNKHCQNCTKALQEKCPACGKSVATSSNACGNCGFSLVNRGLVNVLIDEANQAILDRDFAVALRRVTEARRAWLADGKDPLAEELRNLNAIIEPQHTAQEKFIKELQELLRKRDFYAARALGSKAKDSLPAGSDLLEAYERQVEPGIAKAEKAVEAANEVLLHQKNLDLVVLRCQEALNACADCAEARAILAKVPPEPPGELTAVLGEKAVRLSWQPGESKNVAYSIVRKQNSRPVSVKDGQKLGTVAGTVFDDVDAEAGIPYYYAVFTDREGVSSNEGAGLSEPVLLLREVEALIERVDDRQIHLSWTAPSNVHEVNVVRSSNGFPASPYDGLAVPTIGQDQAVDSAVENGRTYYYTVFCQFKDANGRLKSTSGVNIKAVPQKPPAPIDKVEILASGQSHNRIVRLNWDEPSKGDVVVVRAAKSQGLTSGATMSRAELTQYGEVLSAHTDHFVDKLDESGVYYYLPVVLFGNVAYIGREQRYASADDVTGLTVHNMGDALRLQWNWPKNCVQVKVAYSHTDWPILETAATTSFTLSRAQYDLNGWFDIKQSATADYYITVFAVIGQGEQAIVSSGTEPSARKLVSLQSGLSLSYKIQKSRFRKKCSLRISVTGEGELPALALVGKPSSLPMHKSDGILIANIESRQVNNDCVQIDLPASAQNSPLYTKLFLADDAFVDRIKISLPKREDLRL